MQLNLSFLTIIRRQQTRRQLLRLAAVIALLLALIFPAGGSALAEASAEFSQIGPQPTRVVSEDDATNIVYPSFSADGSTLLFEAFGELTPSAGSGSGSHVFTYDLATQTFEQIDVAPSGRSESGIGRGDIEDSTVAAPDISADGRWVLFAHGDGRLAGEQTATSGTDLYLRDTDADSTIRLNIPEGGNEGFNVNGLAISDDGGTAVFTTSNEYTQESMIDADQPEECQKRSDRLYSIDIPTREISLRALPADLICEGAPVQVDFNLDLSGNGRYVTYTTLSDRLIDGPSGPSDTSQVYREDLQTGEIVLVSRSGSPGDGGSFDSTISTDGRFIAYTSEATNLADADDNFRTDIFVTDVQANTTRLVSLDENGQPASDDSFAPTLSANGQFVSFVNDARLSGPADQDGRDGNLKAYRAEVNSGSPALRVDLNEPNNQPGGELDFAQTGIANNGSVVYVSRRRDLPNPTGGLYIAPSSTGPATPPPPAPEPETGPTAAELDAAISTAIVVSGARFSDGQGSDGFHGGPADYGVLATINSFADALSGAVLAQQGPLLLTRRDALDAQTRAEFDRALGGSGTIYVLGGEAALTSTVTDSLTAAGYTVQRLSGASRFETSTAIAGQARTLFGDTGQVALARAFGPEGNPTAAWADSVTGGGWAADTGTPIVLTPTESVHPAVQTFLDGDQPTTVHLLGGTAALSTTLESVPGARRTAGATRFDTARQIALQLWGRVETGARGYIILDATNELGWAYGLPTAGIAADLDAPFLAVGGMTPPETLAAVTGCDDQVGLATVGPVATGIIDELAAQDDQPC